MLGRLTDEQMDNFRQGRQGHLVLPAPVADAGLLAVPDRVDGPRPCARSTARFMKYLASRGLIDAAKAEQRKVWAFLGDGETDEVESLGAIGMAGRESSTT
jgi:pyruvate dehydrogenase E1 component